MRLVQHRAKVENIASKFEGEEENLSVLKRLFIAKREKKQNSSGQIPYF